MNACTNIFLLISFFPCFFAAVTRLPPLIFAPYLDNDLPGISVFELKEREGHPLCYMPEENFIFCFFFQPSAEMLRWKHCSSRRWHNFFFPFSVVGGEISGRGRKNDRCEFCLQCFTAGTTGVLTGRCGVVHIFDLHLRSTCRYSSPSSGAAAATVAALLSGSLIACRFQTVRLGCNYVDEKPVDRPLPQHRRLQSHRTKGVTEFWSGEGEGAAVG